MLVVVLVTTHHPPGSASPRRLRGSTDGDVHRPSHTNPHPNPKLPRSTPHLPLDPHTNLDPHSLVVLKLLAQEPILATNHIQALAFTDGTSASREEICRRTLRRLTRSSLIYRARGQAGRAGGGSLPATYALTTAGERLLARREGRAPSRYRRRPAEASTALRAHQLAIADVHVALVIASRAAGYTVRWQGEPGCWWEFTGSAGRERLKPDGYVEIEGTGESRIAWLEVDQGTQSVPTTIAAKVRRYCRAARAKAKANEPIPLVIFVVAQAARRERIAAQFARWAAQEGLSVVVAARLLHAVSPADVVALLGAPERAPPERSR